MRVRSLLMLDFVLSWRLVVVVILGLLVEVSSIVVGDSSRCRGGFGF